MSQPRPHWSYSAISQYLRCPLQYYFQRVLGIPSRTTSSSLALGSAVHAGLAEYHRRLMERRETSPEAVTKAFRDDWQEREANETVQFREGDTRNDCIAQGLQPCRDWGQSNRPIETAELVPLETPQEALACSPS